LNHELLQKFFRNQCNSAEIKQVYRWFTTSEGRKYFEEQTERDIERYSDSENLLITPDISSDEIFTRIKQSRRKKVSHSATRHSGWKIKAAVAAIICISMVTAAIIYQTHTLDEANSAEIVYRTISTGDEQHRIITLSDGSQIRLNSNSTIEVPETFLPDKRHIVLNGEAWFKIAPDPLKPFSVQANQATIHVLGTEFNVKMDEAAGNIQIAVSEGTVAFESRNGSLNEGIRTTLSRNNFALYYPASDEIIIENAPVINYMSWIDGKLFFDNEPLWQVSRTLERLYNVSFTYAKQDLNQLTLSADLSRSDLHDLLSIISQTLNIEYEMDSSAKKISWTSNNNQPITNHSE